MTFAILTLISAVIVYFAICFGWVGFIRDGAKACKVLCVLSVLAGIGLNFALEETNTLPQLIAVFVAVLLAAIQITRFEKACGR